MHEQDSGWRVSRQTVARGVPPRASQIRAGRRDNSLKRDAPATFSQIMTRGSIATAREKALAACSPANLTTGPHAGRLTPNNSANAFSVSQIVSIPEKHLHHLHCPVPRGVEE